MRIWIPFLFAAALLGEPAWGSPSGETPKAQPLFLKGTVVGRGVGWETDTLVTWLSVVDGSPVKVEIYSPGFDPRDYRAALRGMEELGDERYDGGKGEVRATFRLEAPGQEVLEEVQFRVEPHRWVTFWEGPLSPGVYLLSARFEGLGKNTFLYRISGARVLLDGIQLVDLSTPGITLRQVGGERSRWTEVLRLEAPGPVQLEFYDEDGPEELRSLVVYSGDGGGELLREERPVSGDLEWVRYTLRQGGLVRFFFSQPPTAEQYSNTFAFRLPQGCLEALTDRFKVLPPGEAKVQVVDPTGRPLDLPLEQRERRFALSLPPGYRMVRLEAKGAVKVFSEGGVEVGCPGGEVRFVVEPLKGLLQVEARVLLPDGRTLPAQVGLRIGEREAKLEGKARLDLPPGAYPLAWVTPGLEPLEPLPQRVEVRPGEEKTLLLTFRPLVSLSLEPEVQERRRGEEGRLVLRATTPYPGLLPGELSVDLPEGLRPLGPDRVSGPLGGGHSLVLELPFVGEAGGVYAPKGRLDPYGLERVGRVRVFLPASLRLEKKALTPEVPIGGVARFQVTAVNEGDEPLEAVLVDRFLDRTERLQVHLEPKSGRSFELEFPIPETASGVLVNRVEVEKGPAGLHAEAPVRVLRPEPRLVRAQEWRAYLPGEVVVATLKVRNDGEAPLSYRLFDRCLDGFTPLEPASFEGVVPPGEERVHTYRLRVEFGPETEGVCQAELLSPVGTLLAESPIARKLLKLEKEAVPGRILEGAQGVFLLKVENPVDHPVEVQLLDIPDRELAASLDLEELPASIRLQPGEVWSFEVSFTAPRPGRYRNTLQAKLKDALAAFPVEAQVESLPILLPERVSTVRLRYEVEGPPGVLLLAHKPPEGGSYVPGSARKDGLPLEDPRVLDGLLIWRLPFPGGKAEGEVTYALRHTRALPPLEEPRLTLVNLDRATPLKGESLGLREYERAKPVEGERPGLIKEPRDGAILGERARASIRAPLGPIEVLLNGKPVPKELLGEAQYDEKLGLQVLNYYGLPLEVGRNVLEVTTPSGYDRVEVYRPGAPERMVVEPVRLVADGRTPIELRIKAVDKAGLPTGFGFITVEASPEPIQADASPLEPGYQVLLKDGVATLLLSPLPSPREVSIRYRFNEIQGSVALSPKGPTQTLWLAQVSLTLGYDPSGFYLQGLGRGYAEAPLLGGSFQGALDTTGDLSRTPEAGFLPLLGAGSEAKRPLSSDDPVAFRWTGEGLSLSYERGPLAFGLPEATALRLKTLGPIEAEAFLGLLPLGSVQEEIIPDGGSSYSLRFRPKPGSFALYLQEGGQKTQLVEGRDYVLDRYTGYIHLSRPLLPVTPDFAPVRLVAVYAPEGSPREELAYGLSVGYREGGFRVRLGVDYLGGRWLLGAEAGYEAGRSQVRVTYHQEVGQPFSLALTLAHLEGALEARGEISYAYGGLPEGQARLAYDLGGLVVGLEQLGGRSLLTAEAKLPFSLRLGGGVGYDFGVSQILYLARLAYQEGDNRVSLSYLSSEEGQLNARFGLSQTLFLEAGLRYQNGSLSGSLGLRQALGGGNLALSYELPTASGEGNRARFGLEAPLPLSDRFSLNVTAGLIYNLGGGTAQAALGLGLRYRVEAFVATLAGEWAGGRLLFRAGAAGTLGDDQALGLDATYQALPEPRLSFGFSYALWAQGFTLLTHHAYKEGTLEGQTLASLHDRDWSIRPSLLYRYPLGDPEGFALELGLGGSYLVGAFGAGANLYYAFLPRLGEGAGAFSLEGTWRALDGLWLSLGYTFGETAFRRPGPYLRIDVFGGSR